MTKTAQSSSLMETIVLELITFLGTQEGLLQQLSTDTGLLPQQLSQEFDHPEVQAGIIDFLLNNEPLLLEFCKATNLTPQEIWRIRLKLPGAPV